MFGGTRSQDFLFHAACFMSTETSAGKQPGDFLQLCIAQSLRSA